MTIPLLPDSAPFTPAQRAWLNGFFAGVLGMQNAGNSAVAAESREAIATPSSEDAEEEYPWHDPSLELAERLKLATSKPLAQRLMAAMAQLDCGACGYICKTYSAAIAGGAEKDLTRCSPGGNDTAKALKRLLTEESNGSPPRLNGHANGAANGHCIEPVAKSSAGSARIGADVTYTRSNPFAARLVQSYQLNHAESAKDTRHVILDLTGSGIRYEPGDSLGILPHNCPDLVEGVLVSLGASGTEQVVSPEGDRKSLRQALATDYTLTRPRPALLELLGNKAADEREAEALKNLGEAETDDLLASNDVRDLLQRFRSARPTIDELMPALARLQPRLYSISSSLKAHPNQVHLTVGVVRYQSRGKMYHGVASTFLGVRCEPGDEIKVYIQPSRFRLPVDPATPIIMVGPGTGIAPFRAFLEERKATNAAGRNWLFFGDQHFGYDFLYRSEIDQYLESGLLTRLDTAFSRDQAEKQYVQHRLLEQGREIWSWLQEGAHFYVCGDARRMALDVDAALQTIVAEHGHRDPAEAKAFLQQLVKEKRYQKDVY
jgi:sulfite reductase (NADPH) flavoprotein alpha-component